MPYKMEKIWELQLRNESDHRSDWSRSRMDKLPYLSRAFGKWHFTNSRSLQPSLLSSFLGLQRPRVCKMLLCLMLKMYYSVTEKL